jgi:hypothetical protein
MAFALGARTVWGALTRFRVWDVPVGRSFVRPGGCVKSVRPQIRGLRTCDRIYEPHSDRPRVRAVAVHAAGHRISAITWFFDRGLFPHFGLPGTLHE